MLVSCMGPTYPMLVLKNGIVVTSILSLIGVLEYANFLYDLMYTLYDLLCILGYCKTQILLLLLIIQ